MGRHRPPTLGCGKTALSESSNLWALTSDSMSRKHRRKGYGRWGCVTSHLSSTWLFKAIQSLSSKQSNTDQPGRLSCPHPRPKSRGKGTQCILHCLSSGGAAGSEAPTSHQSLLSGGGNASSEEAQTMSTILSATSAHAPSPRHVLLICLCLRIHPLIMYT